MATLLVAMGLSAVAAQPAAETEQPVDETVILQLRIWQRVTDPEELWVSAREAGGRWDTFGTVPLKQSDRGSSAGYPSVSGSESAQFISYKVQLAGVGLRVWQRYSNPESISIESCVSPCQPPTFTEWTSGWRHLGKTPLAMNDGHSPRGYYRYGNLTLAVPRDNPGLQSDRDHLLALKAVLEGGATELDWDVGTAIRDWEGVAVEGFPQRVVGLDLSERGLAGELWGYIGDLTQLRELRLDNNNLRGMLPSKLTTLSQLSVLTLAGNDFSGCIPWNLQPTVQHDFSELENEFCMPPTQGTPVGPATYYEFHDGLQLYAVFFDVPPGRVVAIRGVLEPFRDSHQTSLGQSPKGRTFYDTQNEDVWIFLWFDEYFIYEILRSHYSGCVFECLGNPSHSSLLEQFAASIWWTILEA